LHAKFRLSGIVENPKAAYLAINGMRNHLALPVPEGSDGARKVALL
jgi:hypothetical protein